MNAPMPKPYILRVDDNYHYMDETYRRTHGEYETQEDALIAARAIVDAFLASAHTPGMTAEALYQMYTSFGDDPFIIGPRDSDFSAWNYARARCEILCAAPQQPHP